jgi:hypothetical protein
LRPAAGNIYLAVKSDAQQAPAPTYAHREDVNASPRRDNFERRGRPVNWYWHTGPRRVVAALMLGHVGPSFVRWLAPLACPLARQPDRFPAGDPQQPDAKLRGLPKVAKPAEHLKERLLPGVSRSVIVAQDTPRRRPDGTLMPATSEANAPRSPRSTACTISASAFMGNFLPRSRVH